MPSCLLSLVSFPVIPVFYRGVFCVSLDVSVDVTLDVRFDVSIVVFLLCSGESRGVPGFRLSSFHLSQRIDTAVRTDSRPPSFFFLSFSARELWVGYTPTQTSVASTGVHERKCFFSTCKHSPSWRCVASSGLV